jgi:hypothetical protein
MDIFGAPINVPVLVKNLGILAAVFYSGFALLGLRTLKSIDSWQLVCTAALCLFFAAGFIWLDSPSSGALTFLLLQSKWTVAGDVAVLWITAFYATVAITSIRVWGSVRDQPS